MASRRAIGIRWMLTRERATDPANEDSNNARAAAGRYRWCLAVFGTHLKMTQHSVEISMSSVRPTQIDVFQVLAIGIDQREQSTIVNLRSVDIQRSNAAQVFQRKKIEMIQRDAIL